MTHEEILTAGKQMGAMHSPLECLRRYATANRLSLEEYFTLVAGYNEACPLGTPKEVPMSRAEWIVRAGTRGRTQGELHAYRIGQQARQDGRRFDEMANTLGKEFGDIEYEALCAGYRGVMPNDTAPALELNNDMPVDQYPRNQRVKDLAVLDWAITNKIVFSGTENGEDRNAPLRRIFDQAVRDLV